VTNDPCGRRQIMLGPALVRRDAVEDVGELSFETRVNGEIVQARPPPPFVLIGHVASLTPY
jgi:hypothetical protein